MHYKSMQELRAVLLRFLDLLCALYYCTKTVRILYVYMYIPDVAADPNPLRSVIKFWYYRLQRCIYKKLIAHISANIIYMHCIVYYMDLMAIAQLHNEVVVNVEI